MPQALYSDVPQALPDAPEVPCPRHFRERPLKCVYAQKQLLVAIVEAYSNATKETGFSKASRLEKTQGFPRPENRDYFLGSL